MACPPYNSHINWIPDPAPSPSRDHGDLTSPSSSRDHGIQTNGKENMPSQGTPRKLPRKLRPQRRKEKQSGPTANHNLPSREAGKEKQFGPTANHNSPSREAGNQPGTSGCPGEASPDLLAPTASTASSVEKRGTSSPAVRPAQSSSASCASKSSLAPAARLEDKFWSYLLPKMTPNIPLTCS